MLFLATMEKTVAFIPQRLPVRSPLEEFIVAPMDEVTRERLLFPMPSPIHPHPIRACEACWRRLPATFYILPSVGRGLSTSIATCIITALSTLGSSRQKQFLRLAGAILGGIVFGMGAQIFVLPTLIPLPDSGSVCAGHCDFSLDRHGDRRLSYLGIQLALAFYLINLQEFTIQTSLALPVIASLEYCLA